MIKLSGLNKTLKTSLLAGVLLGVSAPLMAKPLFTDTELPKRVSVYNKVLNNEDILACNRSVDSTKYFSAGWDYKQKIPNEWKKEFQQCIVDKLQDKIDAKIKATEKERQEKVAKENAEIMRKAKEKAKKVREQFMAFEIKEKSKYIPNEKQLRIIIDKAYETGISRWLDDLHRKYGYKNTEETIKALGFNEYGEEADIIRYGVENYVEEQEKGLQDNSSQIALLKTQAFDNEENKVAFKYKH
ncbi:hypothetical protein [Helicobacter cetorum]|uniref:Uncharacterized protein n=2 Tax=Helicobacter cetorum TaxID=138563 RepID=I0EPN5_HELC0|nr:hypothetical protein [Helicobacter cetorum]AFI04904.1 hypothetical protein HCW_08235 [Helicobacter cetorum MIT 00-7128]